VVVNFLIIISKENLWYNYNTVCEFNGMFTVISGYVSVVNVLTIISGVFGT